MVEHFYVKFGESVFRYREENRPTDKPTNKHINADENTTHETTVGVGNQNFEH